MARKLSPEEVQQFDAALEDRESAVAALPSSCQTDTAGAPTGHVLLADLLNELFSINGPGSHSS